MQAPDGICIVPMTEPLTAPVAALEAEIFSVPWTRQGFVDTLAMDNALFYVALNGDEVAGYCGVYLAADEGEITNVASSPAYRRRGIADALVHTVLQEAAKRGAEQIFLEVRASNTPAIRLYEKLGFTQAGRRRNFYTRPVEDAIVMMYAHPKKQA